MDLHEPLDNIEYEIQTHLDPKKKGSPATDWCFKVLIKSADDPDGTCRTMTFAECESHCADELQAYLDKTCDVIAKELMEMELQDDEDTASGDDIRGAVDAMATLCRDDQGYAIVLEMIKKTGPENEYERFIESIIHKIINSLID